jgi:hypothetical protein
MSWSLSIGAEVPVDGHTYNLTRMWRLAGVVRQTTRELDGLLASEIANRAREGLERAVELAPAFRSLNPENGWGDYDGFVEVLFGLWRAAAAAEPNTRASWSG